MCTGCRFHLSPSTCIIWQHCLPTDECLIQSMPLAEGLASYSLSLLQSYAGFYTERHTDLSPICLMSQDSLLCYTQKSNNCCYQVGSLQMNPYMLRWDVNSRQLVWILTNARWKTHLDSSNTLIVKDRNGCSFSFWKKFWFWLFSQILSLFRDDLGSRLTEMYSWNWIQRTKAGILAPVQSMDLISTSAWLLHKHLTSFARWICFW